MARRRPKLSSPLRRRKLLAGAGYLLIVALASLFAVEHFGPRSIRARDDWSAFDHQSFVVSKIVDGDTIHIRRSDTNEETTVRLLGIDAPEMIDPATGRPAHWSDRATSYMQARAGGKTVTIRLEPIETRDTYNRLLAYVYLSDTDCLNIAMVRDGHAYAHRRFRHSYRPQYEQAESEARTKLRGLWKDITEDLMPPWRRAWLHERNRDQ